MVQRYEEISEKEFPFPEGLREDYGKVEGEYPEKVSPKEMDLYVKTLTPSKRREPSRRPGFLIGLLFVLLGVLLLIAFIFMKPEEEVLQIGSQRIRRSIRSIEEVDQHKAAGFRRSNEVKERFVEWDTLEVGKPMTTGHSEPVMVIHEKGVDERKAKTGKEGGVVGYVPKGPELGGGKKGKLGVSRVEKSERRVIPEGKPVKGVYTINIGSFRDEKNAKRVMKEWEEKGYSVLTERATVSQKGTWYRVSVGRFSSREEAQSFASGLGEKGINNYFVRKLGERKE
jgi:hypothetical protein